MLYVEGLAHALHEQRNAALNPTSIHLPQGFHKITGTMMADEGTAQHLRQMMFGTLEDLLLTHIDMGVSNTHKQAMGRLKRWSCPKDGDPLPNGLCRFPSHYPVDVLYCNVLW
jgi:hypothetical protein